MKYCKWLLAHFEEIIGSALLLGMCAAASLQAGSRLLSQWTTSVRPVFWTEEACTLLFIWLSFVGASYALRTGDHFAVEALREKLPATAARWLRVAGLAGVVLFAGLLVWFGAQMTWRVLSLLTVVFVVGGILGGYVTPTEAAIVAVLWSFIVCFFFYRELKLADILPALTDTVKITGVVVLCIAASAPFAWLMTIEEIPAQLAGGLLGLTDNPLVLKLIILAILIGVGTFLDLTPAMILLLPILMPVADSLGMAPVHFGVVMVMALGIGQCTPPVGIALFVACSVAKTRIEHVFLPLMPYLMAMLAALLLVTFIPFLSVWLPAVLAGG